MNKKHEKEISSESNKRKAELVLMVLPLIGFILGAAIIFYQQNQDNALCLNIIQASKLETWKKGEISETELKPFITQFDKLNGENPVEFKEGDRIPKDTLLKIDFTLNTNSDWKNFPVKPIVYFRNYGLFQTIAEFSAPTSGFCLSISTK